jgi:hypothetical protein
MKRTWYVYLVGAVAMLSIAAFVILRGSENPYDFTKQSEATIALTKNGFVPRIAYLTEGTMVTFTTQIDNQF